MTLVSNRRIVRNTGMLYLRTLLTLIVSLYTSRVVLITLGIEDYGVYNVVGGFVSILGFLNNSMAAAVQRFLSFEIGQKDNTKLAKIFSMSVVIHFIIALIIFILAETVGLWAIKTQLTLPPERMGAAQWVYQFSVFIFVVNVVSVPYNAAIIANERMAVFAWISIVDALLKLLIIFMLKWGGSDKLILYTILMFVSALIVRSIYIIYCRIKFKECALRFFWDKSLFKSLTSFAAWNLWGNIAVALYGQGVNIILNIFFGPAVNAARGIAYQVQGTISGFVQNFQIAVNPQIIKSFAADDLKYMHLLIFRGAKYSFFLLFIASVPILLEAEIILKLWLSLVPEHAVIFTQMVIITILIDSISGTLMTAAQASGKIKLYQAVVGGLLILILPISYFFLSLGYPPEATFCISISISIIAFIARLIIISPLVSLPIAGYVKSVILRIIGVIVLSIPYPLIVRHLLSDGLQRLIIVSVTSALCTGLALYVVGIDRSERAYMRKKISQFFNKKQAHENDFDA